MKSTARSSRKPRVDFQAEVFTLSNAKTYLGRLLRNVSQGKTVYIVRGQQRFLLQEAPPIDPIPLRPPGYFAHCYSDAEIQEENRLAKASVVRAPADLE